MSLTPESARKGTIGRSTTQLNIPRTVGSEKPCTSASAANTPLIGMLRDQRVHLLLEALELPVGQEDVAQREHVLLELARGIDCERLLRAEQGAALAVRQVGVLRGGDGERRHVRLLRVGPERRLPRQRNHAQLPEQGVAADRRARATRRGCDRRPRSPGRRSSTPRPRAPRAARSRSPRSSRPRSPGSRCAASRSRSRPTQPTARVRMRPRGSSACGQAWLARAVPARRLCWAAMAERYQSVFRPGLFEGKTILVTGGGTGLGRCTAHELAALGANVVVAARRAEPLEQTAAEIHEAGGRCETAVLNVRDEKAVDEVVAGLAAKHGRIDGLVNNAGGQFVAARGADVAQRLAHGDRPDPERHVPDVERRLSPQHGEARRGDREHDGRHVDRLPRHGAHGGRARRHRESHHHPLDGVGRVGRARQLRWRPARSCRAACCTTRARSRSASSTR